MLLIILPLPLINYAIFLSIFSITICLIIFPITLINISILMKQLTISTSNIIFPVSYIYRSVLPTICAKSLSFINLIPIPFVYTAVFKMNNFFIVRQNRLLGIRVLFFIDQTGKFCSFLIIKNFTFFNFEHQIRFFIYTLILAISHNFKFYNFINIL